MTPVTGAKGRFLKDVLLKQLIQQRTSPWGRRSRSAVRGFRAASQRGASTVLSEFQVLANDY